MGREASPPRGPGAGGAGDPDHVLDDLLYLWIEVSGKALGQVAVVGWSLSHKGTNRRGRRERRYHNLCVFSLLRFPLRPPR